MAQQTEDRADEATIRAIATAEAGRPGALMPILVAVQRRFGWLPPATVEIVADVLNVSRADVAGVASFYADFRIEPAGRLVVGVCRAEACQAAGGEALAAYAEERLGCGFGATAADGSATLDAVYCFGNCALAPAASVGGRLIGRASPERLDAAIRAETER